MKPHPLALVLLAVPLAASAGAKLAVDGPWAVRLPAAPLGAPTCPAYPIFPAKLVLSPSVFLTPTPSVAGRFANARAYATAPTPVAVDARKAETSALGEALSLAGSKDASGRWDGSRKGRPFLADLAHVGLTDVGAAAILQELHTFRTERRRAKTAKPAKPKRTR
ncbi:MAG: hypothetical protein HYZ74_08595 [Elusimicrobia bacterium]|nr:hypothetical protein [Elusimicrobiota bacterium]